ncbi:alpha/beta hydrolase [Aquibium carbonis]|nr:alpha/beta fold hydrolase [Aquibium carbonis]
MLRLLVVLGSILLSGLAMAGDRAVDAGGFPATLSAAEADGPLVLMISGSGPTDRDGNNAFGVRAGTLGKLAAALASRGIASLRYDKRGLPGSVPVGDEAEVTFETFVADLEAVAAWARSTSAHRPLVLMGHSEGGMVAIEAARRAPHAYDGLILLATPGRPPAETMRDQLANLPEPERSDAFGMLADLEAGRRIDTVPPSLAGLFRASVQPFVISMLALRPAETLAALDLPVLVIGGGTDIQVGRPDFDALAAARTDAQSHWVERMNHILVDAPADFAGNVATYADPDVELSGGLADRIADFVTGIDAR